jgi:hypothetical protein
MKRFLIPLLFVSALTLLPDRADARGYSRSRFDFTFGFSSGYHSYGGFNYGYSRPYYSRGYYAPAFRSRFYYEDPVYYRPAPVVIVEPAPYYVYPRRSYYYSDRCAPRYYREERTYYYER